MHLRRRRRVVSPTRELRGSSAPGTGSIWTVEMGKIKSSQIERNETKRNVWRSNNTPTSTKCCCCCVWVMRRFVYNNQKEMWKLSIQQDKRAKAEQTCQCATVVEREEGDKENSEQWEGDRLTRLLGIGHPLSNSFYPISLQTATLSSLQNPLL